MILHALFAAAAALAPQKLALPAPAPVSMDYLAADGGQVWVPAGNAGKVFVLEGGAFRTIGGFATKKGRGDRLMGPSSVSLSADRAFVGNRGDSQICAIDRKSLEKAGCAEVPGMPDGTFYVAPAHEVWVTTPRDKALQILDVSGAPKLVGKIDLPGEPEGYAVDAKRGVVYTNLEDKDRTLAIDVKTRKIVSTWEPKCGEAGPRGIAFDAAHGLVLVACTNGVVALDAKTGAAKGRIETGRGVDNIDFANGRVYASAGRAGKLTVAEVAADGSLKAVASGPVPAGARVVVVGSDGTAYAADSAGGALWVVKP